MKSSEAEIRPTLRPHLAAAVRRCRDEPLLLAELRDIYRRADPAVAGAGAICLGGGACCKFDLAGHRLYLTGLELALLTAVPPPGPGRAVRMRCPYQVGPACAAYDRRPLGCRTFFCRSRGDTALARLHEQYHREIRRLHQRRCIPYSYGELTGMFLDLQSLAQAQLTANPRTRRGTFCP